ncbi:hypothetical protein BJ508DRAFT_315517 [Ascobolus immersus RN42]|uniref:F-box domain-containing protein n=1 Tax=Ascobolus immersus RN42 TaxID=1160509 RepID=A0A3N4HAG8_ASCIM|nr:hypothetical protein BJ508DRAFT_315517 [Ascobolus immersus RN42]
MSSINPSPPSRHLPTELLELVFIHLPDPHTYLTLSTASRHFHAVANAKYTRINFASQWFFTYCDGIHAPEVINWIARFIRRHCGEPPAICTHYDYKLARSRLSSKPKVIPNIRERLHIANLFYDTKYGPDESLWQFSSLWFARRREKFMTEILPRRMELRGESVEDMPPLEELVLDLEDVVMAWDMVGSWQQVAIEDRDDIWENFTAFAFNRWRFVRKIHGCLCGKEGVQVDEKRSIQPRPKKRCGNASSERKEASRTDFNTKRMKA